MTRRCWSFREEIQRKYGRVVLLHGMVGVRLLAALVRTWHRGACSHSSQNKWLHVYDPKALHAVFLKDQDIYEEPVMCVLSGMPPLLPADHARFLRSMRITLGPGLLGTLGLTSFMSQCRAARG